MSLEQQLQSVRNKVEEDFDLSNEEQVALSSSAFVVGDVVAEHVAHLDNKLRAITTAGAPDSRPYDQVLENIRETEALIDTTIDASTLSSLKRRLAGYREELSSAYHSGDVFSNLHVETIPAVSNLEAEVALVRAELANAYANINTIEQDVHLAVQDIVEENAVTQKIFTDMKQVRDFEEQQKREDRKQSHWDSIIDAAEKTHAITEAAGGFFSFFPEIGSIFTGITNIAGGISSAVSAAQASVGHISHLIKNGIHYVNLGKQQFHMVAKLASEASDLDSTIVDHPWVKQALGHISIGTLKRIRDSESIFTPVRPQPHWHLWIHHQSLSDFLNTRGEFPSVISKHLRKPIVPTKATLMIEYHINDLESKRLMITFGAILTNGLDPLNKDISPNIQIECVHMKRVNTSSPYTVVNGTQDDGSPLLFDPDDIIKGKQIASGKVLVPFSTVRKFLDIMANIEGKEWDLLNHNTSKFVTEVTDWFQSGKRPSWWSSRFSASVLKSIVDDEYNPSTVGAISVTQFTPFHTEAVAGDYSQIATSARTTPRGATGNDENMFATTLAGLGTHQASFSSLLASVE
jgi:hypothetical protein